MSVLEKWLQTYDAPSTRGSYSALLKKFFLMIYPGEELNVAADQYMEERVKDLKKLRGDILEYWQLTRSLAPSSRLQSLSVLRTFLLDHDIELPDSFWKRFTRKMRGKTRPLQQDIIPTSEQLRQFFLHMPISGRALFTLQASAGTRIGETLLIESGDLDFDKSPPRIRLRAETTKGKVARTVFITPEAKEALLEWMKVRDEYLELKRTPFLIKKDLSNDRRVFPFTKANAYAIWKLALRKTGLFEKDVNTGFQRIRPHNLRKRFRTQLAIVIPVDVIEVIMGHMGYQTDAYRRYTLDELGEFYLKGQHVLFLSTNRAELERVAQKTRESEMTIRELQSRIQELEFLRERERKDNIRVRLDESQEYLERLSILEKRLEELITEKEK
jgi:integrase